MKTIPIHRLIGRMAAVFLVAALLFLSLPGTGAAHSYKLGNILVGHVWAPPPGPGADGMAVYGPIFNQGKADVRLVGASSPIAGQVRFQKTKDGKTTWPAAIDLHPGKPLALAAWREHLWLSGLHTKPKPGDAFDLTLDFGSAGKLAVKVLVQQHAGH